MPICHANPLPRACICYLRTTTRPNTCYNAVAFPVSNLEPKMFTHPCFCWSLLTCVFSCPLLGTPLLPLLSPNVFHQPCRSCNRSGSCLSWAAITTAAGPT